MFKTRKTTLKIQIACLLKENFSFCKQGGGGYLSLTIFAIFVLINNAMFAQGGALWTPSGQTAATTTRQVAIKITAPTADLDVNGTLRIRGMAGFDTSLTAKLISTNALRVLGLAQLDALLVNGNTQINGMLTVGSFQINNSSIISSTGNILFGNNNLSTTGNVNAANISALDSTVNSQQLAVDGLQLAVGNQEVAVDSLQLTVSNQQLTIGNQQSAINSLTDTVSSIQNQVTSIQSEVGNQQGILDSVIAVIAADTISSDDFLPISGGTLTGNLILNGNLTLNSSSIINSNVGASGLTLSYGGIPNVIGFATDISGELGQFLGFVPASAALLLDPNTLTPNGVIELKDKNSLGAVHISAGNPDTGPGRAITLNGSTKKVTIYNEEGDGIVLDGINGQSQWNAPLGVKFTGGSVEVDSLRFPDGSLQTTSASGIQSSQWTTSGNKIFYPATGTGNVEINGNLKTSAVHGSGGLFLSGIDPATNLTSKAGNITLTPGGYYYPGGDVILKGGGDGDYYNQEGGAKITLKGYNYWGNSNIMMNIGAGIGGIGNTPNYFSVSDANDTMLLKLMDTGNMGIGTSTPTAKLDVNGDVKVSGDIISDGNISANTFNSTKFSSDTLFVTRIMPTVGDSEIHIGDSSIVINGVSNHIYTIKKTIPGCQSYGKLTIQGQPLTANTPGCPEINNNSILNPYMGHVGIGTTNPLAKLDIRGDILISGSLLNVNQSGNVGIGIINPSYKLDVCGTIRAKEVRINLAGCDFVFDKDYKLLTLKQRKQKVLTQGYMLYMETARGKDEFSLNELTRGLWQNTEEHELYLYNHDERIETLEKLIEKQNIIIEHLEREIELMKKK